MKGKREFYLYGNDRKFHDDYIISIMTGEPMPKKWQQFLELTPEEKARWDNSLRLDAQYRIAEAQGFPNGIPGGRTRGNALYILTQMEEEYERNQLKKQPEEAMNPYGQYFAPIRRIYTPAQVIYPAISRLRITCGKIRSIRGKIKVYLRHLHRRQKKSLP